MEAATFSATSPNPIQFSLPTTTVQAVQGQAFSLSGSVTDSTDISPYHLSVNYGDGTVNRLGGNAVTSFTASHAYANAGTYTVVLTFNDDGGQRSASDVPGDRLGFHGQ